MRAHKILSLIQHLRFGQDLAGIGDLQHRHIGGAVIDDGGRLCAGGHVLDGGRRHTGNLRLRGADIGGGLEIDFHHADAGQGLALDMFNIVHRCGHQPFKRRHDAAQHFRRRQAAILENHTDHGNVDAGKNIGRHIHHRHRTGDGDQDGEHDEGEGPLQGDTDDPHHGVVNSGRSKRIG